MAHIKNSVTSIKLIIVFLISLPILSIIGVQLVNFYHNNLLLILLFPLLAVTPVLAVFGLIPKKIFPLAIAMVAIALLFSTSMISTQLYGVDVNNEYYYASLVKNNSFWDFTIPHDYNAVLSIVMLAPIFSITTGMNLILIFKVVYPFLFSLVPLVLYMVLKKQTDCTVAFLSVTFVMFGFTFFTEMVNVARQEIAEIFLVLLLLVVMREQKGSRKMAVLSILLGASLVVSHYALAYIFMFSLIFALFIFLFLNKSNVRFVRIRDILQIANFRSEASKLLSLQFIAFYCIFVFCWYFYVASSSSFNSVVGIGNTIITNVFNDAFNPSAAQGLYLIISQTASLSHDITKYLNILLELFIFIGLLAVIFRKKTKNFYRQYITFSNEYLSFSVVSLVICILAIIMPYFASQLNTTRLYHVTLLFLAPFCIIGGVFMLKALSKSMSSLLKKRFILSDGIALKFMAFTLTIFLLFGSGFVYEVTQSYPNSVSLSQDSIINHGTTDQKVAFYNMYTPLQEAISAQWLSQYKVSTTKTFADITANANALKAYAMLSASERSIMNSKTVFIPRDSYVYLRNLNIIDAIMVNPRQVTGAYYNFNTTAIIGSLMDQADKVYTNGGSEIYYACQLVNFTAK